MPNELFDKGQEADLHASAEMLEQCAALVRASMSVNDARALLALISSNIHKNMNVKHPSLYEALSASLSTLSKDLPSLETKKRKAHQIRQAKMFITEFHGVESKNIKKSEIIKNEYWAIETLLNEKIGYKGVLSYLQKRYGKQLQEQGIAPFCRQEVQRKISQLRPLV